MSKREIGTYQPRVVVRFKSYVHLPYTDDAADSLNESGAPWKRLSQMFFGITLAPLFTGIKPDQIVKLEERARAADPTYKPNLRNYFVVKVPAEFELETIAKEFSALTIVDTAYVEPPPQDPPSLVDPSDDPRSPYQGHLEAAPAGIDMRYAWDFTGADGAGQALVDLERGWTFQHEDLVCHNITCFFGNNYDFEFHGTRVLGVIAGCDNRLGGIGITPGLSSVRCVSQWLTGGGYSTSAPIVAATAQMNPGDILLLEAQTSSDLPVEREPAVFDAIRLATALGIVVVEAAGNGATNLDGVVVNGVHIFDRQVRDSGAILVAAADTDRSPAVFSCFGSRIDCYAWGQQVNTSDSDAGRSINGYTDGFGGTSSASAIIAGAALSVQGLAQAYLRHRLSPRQMRNILSDPTLGTASANPLQDSIGVMPNLKAIIESDVLNIAPDIYVRDFVGDPGDAHALTISGSPDLIVHAQEIVDPQAAFGEGSGTEDSPPQEVEVIAGRDNFLYIRARNRGGSVAKQATATIYWSPVTTLFTPDFWTLVDSKPMADIPTGNILTVSDAIVWRANAMPPTGLYHLVVLVNHEHDPAPALADFRNWDNFQRFVQASNNVTWRDINVVDLQAESDDSLVPPSLKFVMAGTPDRPRSMQLEIVGSLPIGAQAELELPERLAQSMAGRPIAKNSRKGTVRIPINPWGRTLSSEIELPAKARFPMQLHVKIPDEAKKHHYRIFARQLHEGKEVGRAVWRLGPRRGGQYAKEAKAH